MKNWDGDVPVDQYDTPATKLAIVRRSEPDREPGCWCGGDGIRQRVERWEIVKILVEFARQGFPDKVAHPIFSTNPDAWEPCECKAGKEIARKYPPRNESESMFIPCVKCGENASIYLLTNRAMCCRCGYAARGLKFIPCIVCGAQSSHNLTTQPTCEYCWPGKVDR